MFYKNQFLVFYRVLKTFCKSFVFEKVIFLGLLIASNRIFFLISELLYRNTLLISFRSLLLPYILLIVFVCILNLTFQVVILEPFGVLEILNNLSLKILLSSNIYHLNHIV